ncbi:MAG: glycosyltransferase family 2 protein [Vicinamibacterales bacterium]
MSARLALGIPAKNEEAVLNRLLDSADAQTIPFDQVLLYDDASTDRTAEIGAQRGLTVVRGHTSMGPSHGKNVLAGRTGCDWIHFHDADEALHPEFVAHARTWMVKDDLDVVLFGTEERDNDSGRWMQSRTWDDGALQADPVRYAILNTITNCGIYRRESFLRAGGFDTSPAKKYNEDQAMHLRLACAGLRFRADDLIGVIVYRRPVSMSASHPLECARAQVEVLKETAAATGNRYAREIGGRLWRLAGVLGAHSDWEYVKAALQLATSIGYADPADEHWAVRLGARVSPVGVVAAREAFIRVLKPSLRA